MTRLLQHVAGLPLLTAASVALSSGSLSSALGQQATPLPKPAVFAPGVISGPANEGTPSFSPDGRTLLFTRSAPRWSVVLESHLGHGRWSRPTVASFSGEWSDSSPAFSPDGSYVVFVSVHRLPPANPTDAPRATSHLYRVDRTAQGWGVPRELPPAVNAFPQIFRPSVAADGSLYFTAAMPGKELSLFRSKCVDGVYRQAEPLAFSDGSVKDVDPEIAPDESFLVFTSRRPFPGETAHEHLFVVARKGNGWGEIQPIRYEGDTANGSSEDNDPRLSPDRRTLYFSSDRTIIVHFPRTHAQAIEDAARLDLWDNSNTNIWTIPMRTL